jgi:hypothetical protein
VSTNPKTVNDLREHLFAALDALNDKDNPMEVERARAVSDIAQTIINTAKVEIEYLKINGGGESGFIEATAEGNLPPGITGRRQHRLRG